MPYPEEYHKVLRGGHLKLDLEFRDEDRELFTADEAKITIWNPDSVKIVDAEDIEEGDNKGIFHYIVRPDGAWDYGVYKYEYTGEDEDDNVFTRTDYFLLSSNAETVYDWQIMNPELLIEDYLVGDIGIEYSTCKRIQPPTIWRYINRAIARIERDIQVRLRPVSIRCGDVKNLRDRITITDMEADIIKEDLVENPYDYEAIQYFYHWGFLQLREYPIIDVTRMAFIYPTGQHIIDFPNQWIKVYHRKGQLQLVPTAGTIDQVMIGQGGQWLPLMSGRLPQNVPQLVYVDYVAGFLKPPETYKDMVAKIACIELLRIVGDAIVKGIGSSSASIDGLSQSVSYVATPTTVFFQARINEYKEDYEAFKKDQKQRDKGIIMTAL